MTYSESGFNQFLRRDLVQDSLSGTKTLSDSDLGPNQAMTVGDIMEKLHNIPASLIVGDLDVNTITAVLGTIGGWSIGSTTLTSGNITLDSANKRILINDGTNDRILIGYSAGGF